MFTHTKKLILSTFSNPSYLPPSPLTEERKLLYLLMPLALGEETVECVLPLIFLWLQAKKTLAAPCNGPLNNNQWPPFLMIHVLINVIWKGGRKSALFIHCFGRHLVL